ncbi:MAG: FAD-dependent oxidoreductase, partial [Myxococcota bacterium]
ERGMQVTVVEAMPDIVPFLPEAMRKRVLAEAAEHDVEIRLGAQVQRVKPGPSGLVLSTATGDIETDVVLVSVGVRPNAALAKEAGLELAPSGAIAVDAQLRTSAPDVYAAGDCADAEHGVSGKSVWIPLALRANRAGKLAGRAMTGADIRAPPVVGTAVFKFFSLEIARTGLSEKEAREANYDVAAAHIEGITRAHYYPGRGKLSVMLLGDRKTRKLLGGAMVGPESAAHRIDTVATALHAGMTVDDFQSMDLAYAPPFGPAWSPLLIAASKLAKSMQ